MWHTIKNNLSALLVAAGSLLMLSAPASAGVLDPFSAQFSVARGDLTLGTASFSLKPWGDGDCRVYHGVASPRSFLRLFISPIKDTSYFCPGDNGQLIPEHYRHKEGGDDDYNLDFDWQKGTVTYHGKKAKDGKTFKAPDGALEPFLIQMAARAWLAHTDKPLQAGERTFTIVDENEIKHYRLAVSPGGEVKTPAGPYQTIKIARVDDKDKQLIFWAAPKLDFLPVRVERHKEGDPVISMELTKYSQ